MRHMSSINWFVSIFANFIITLSDQNQNMRSMCMERLRMNDSDDLWFLIKLEKYSMELYLRFACFKKGYTEFINLLEYPTANFLEDFIGTSLYVPHFAGERKQTFCVCALSF